MAIIVEYFKTRKDGVILNRTYSDLGYKIERDGILYDEAIDPIELNRIYIETTQLIELDNPKATIEDYQEALSEFGVNV